MAVRLIPTKRLSGNWTLGAQDVNAEGVPVGDGDIRPLITFQFHNELNETNGTYTDEQRLDLIRAVAKRYAQPGF